MIYEASISQLHPTQMTVGLRAVMDRYDKLAALSTQKRTEYLLKRPVPVVIGPGEHSNEQLYLIDRHHMTRALSLLNIEKVYCEVKLDLSELTPAFFWREMGQRRFARAANEKGVSCSFFDIPSRIEDLKDDPYRSLASKVRKKGGYAKTPKPFAEFEWADYFRSRIPMSLLLESFKDAVVLGCLLATQPSAKNLPGYYEAPDRSPCEDPRFEVIHLLQSRMSHLSSILDVDQLLGSKNTPVEVSTVKRVLSF